jgi:hypothetical protein
MSRNLFVGTQAFGGKDTLRPLHSEADMPENSGVLNNASQATR